MDKQRNRSEIDEKYKWDLTKIYKNDDEWYRDYNVLKEEIKEISKYKGILTQSSGTLLSYLDKYNELDRKMEKLYMYSHLNYDADTTNPVYQEMQGKIQNLISNFSDLDSFSTPELMSTDYSVILKYIDEEPKLKDYRHVLLNIYRYKDHTLSESEEKMLSMLSIALDSSSEVFEYLTDTDMTFGTITDGDGREVELTESNYIKFLNSKDRGVRKRAFERLLSTYGSYKNTIAATFSGNVKTLTSIAKVKHYSSSLESSLFYDNIDLTVYNNLIDTISDNLDVLFKYYELKKDYLKLDELHLYDLYVDMVSDFDKEYTFEDAKELVIKALSPLGDTYINDLKKAFDDRWIDVYNNVGKRGGAYSSGGYDTYPYVLLNFEGRLKDVSTLAHELGHSMHSYYSIKNNTYPNYHYKIFVAEVASTVNELLLNYYLLENSKDIKEKLYILNSLMDLYKGTIYRQIMFAEFERDMHEAYENGEILTNEFLCNKYYQLNKKYFGNDVVVDDLIKYEWERIPHFYYNFYVYKYAVGLSCACYIVDGILNKRENALDNYLKFLSLGGSDYPANELKTAGIDINSSEVFISAINMFNDTISKFKSLTDDDYKKIK